jgi:hypothetical protein
LHFWVGSFCGVVDDNNGRPPFPRGVIAISDTITLIEDMGNQIPDKSWMLYLLEMFNKQDIASELNLICQFDNQDYFEAIFSGVNRYRFRQVLPIVGHSYLRQIVINSYTQSISYILEDRNTRQIESFDLSLLNSGFVFETRNHFTGFKVSNDGKRYCNLSIGRVQGPTLAFVVDREMEIRKHVPEPYWTISAEFEKDGHIIKAHYYQQKISTLSQATIVNACKDQDGRITKIEKQKITLKAPTPFNLGDLQKESYRVFRFSPSYTLSIAEKLYIAALISYPRTSSQKLPISINYKKIISGLSKISYPYTKLAPTLLEKDHLTPNEGSKSDPAHPAIYPTGEKPKGKLDGVELKLFDLIIRKFWQHLEIHL